MTEIETLLNFSHLYLLGIKYSFFLKKKTQQGVLPIFPPSQQKCGICIPKI